jgi:hypothetical protein
MSEQIVSREKNPNSLDGSADEFAPTKQLSGIDNCKPSFESFIGSSFLNIYDLDARDLRVIAILFEKLLDGEMEIKAGHLLKSLEKDKIAAFREIKRITRLKEMGILEGTGRCEEGAEGPVSLLRSTLRLSCDIIDKLCNQTDKPGVAIEEGYKDNIDYLSDQFERLRLMEEMKSSAQEKRSLNRSGSDTKKVERELKKHELKIIEKLRRTQMTFPLELLKKKKKLSDKEELIIIALLRTECEISRNKCWEVGKLLDFISETPYEKLRDYRLFRGGERLIRDEFISIESFSSQSEQVRYVTLHSDLKTKLLGEYEKRGKENFYDDFFEIIKPVVPLEKIILSQKTSKQINLAISMLQGNIPHRLRSWGVRGSLQTKIGRKFQPSVNILFYGPPGTGKTLTANAMAHRLRRNILTLDCSKILGRLVGESEKNTRMIFDRYKKMSKQMKRPPILLLNEADQFLHRRIEVSMGADHMYNQLQSIFLEQMEKFEGVLIATTNLRENIDEAFSRRFQQKIEFGRPDPFERIGLWQLHLPESAPLADDVDIKCLADCYNLSGGQIAVVIKNAAARAALRGDRLVQADFISACEDEIAGNFDEKSKRRVGF